MCKDKRECSAAPWGSTAHFIRPPSQKIRGCTDGVDLSSSPPYGNGLEHGSVYSEAIQQEVNREVIGLRGCLPQKSAEYPGQGWMVEALLGRSPELVNCRR